MATQNDATFRDNEVYEFKIAVSKLGRGGDGLLRQAIADGLPILQRGRLRLFSGREFRLWLENRTTIQSEEVSHES